MNEFNFDEMKVSEDGKSIIGFEDYLKPIKEKRPSSFPKVDNQSNGGENGENPNADGFDEAKARRAIGLPPKQ